VDDDMAQLDLCAYVLKMSGFAVLSADSAIDAISIMALHCVGTVDITVLDYEMPMMNGCLLADYLRARYPDMKIVLRSGAVDIPESEMGSIDVFVPKGDGVARLLEVASLLVPHKPEPADRPIGHMLARNLSPSLLDEGDQE
jgi:DNA-binding NtrC family response regulator